MPPHHVEDAVLERGSEEEERENAHTQTHTQKKPRIRKWRALTIAMGGRSFGGGRRS